MAEQELMTIIYKSGRCAKILGHERKGKNPSQWIGRRPFFGKLRIYIRLADDRIR